MGDGIMALFGASLAHEDLAVHACYAALRMQERNKAYAPPMAVGRVRFAVAVRRVGVQRLSGKLQVMGKRWTKATVGLMLFMSGDAAPVLADRCQQT